MLSVNVPPFDNADCRKAVLYAADHEAMQAAWGGPVGGDIATTALPPTVAGYKKADVYGFLADKNGNADKAKEALTACGQPNGFSTKIAVRGDRPKDVASGEALQQSLDKVGIKTEIVKYPSGDWSAQYAGNPEFVHANGLGIIIAGWGADWPSGFGFLSQIVDGGAIAPSGGNYNQMELNDPAVNELARQGHPDHRPRPAQRGLGRGRRQGHGVRRAAAVRLREDAALPRPAADERLRQPVVRHVRLHDQSASSSPPAVAHPSRGR